MVSPGYRAFMASPEWADAKARYWASPWTIKRCCVCGAGRRSGHTQMHHLRYRTNRNHVRRALGMRPGVERLATPHLWELLPACGRPCHLWLITPLSHWPYVRAALFAALAGLALVLGAPALWTAVAFAAAVALPRAPEATFLAFLLGLPVRLVRLVARIVT